MRIRGPPIQKTARENRSRLLSTSRTLVPARGFEPRLEDSKSSVLPLDDAGMLRNTRRTSRLGPKGARTIPPRGRSRQAPTLGHRTKEHRSPRGHQEPDGRQNQDDQEDADERRDLRRRAP